jgi:uncharacterized hydrophobic protein (TIGR00271 family)
MKNKIFDIFDLHNGEDDKQQTLQRINSNISFRGANLWILACAIIISSVGLNINSTAVIIGAMLISPLMGPIISSGFALGMYDFDLLKTSLRNLFIATATSLLVSAAYFYLSPFKEVHSELLSRISPNIYDILIAFFGGIVGVIAVTRVEKGNPIPGVAIATALMPPLCTAGYGIATGNVNYFLGAFFLYCINCIFICIATFIVVKYLKYPAKQIELSHKKRVRFWITAIMIIIITPSLYFSYSLYNQQKFAESLNLFIEKELTSKGDIVVYKKTNLTNKQKNIELAFLSKRFSKNEIETLNAKLIEYGITKSKIIIKQDSVDNILNLRNSILNEVNRNKSSFNEKDARIRLLETEISKVKEEEAKNNLNGERIFKESKALFPAIQSLSISRHVIFHEDDTLDTAVVLTYQSKRELAKSDKSKFENWIKQRLELPRIEIYKQ